MYRLFTLDRLLSEIIFLIFNDTAFGVLLLSIS
jgi:hypothetical protein